MKKLILLLLLIGTVYSCSNPLDSVYNEPTFNNDIKLIKDVNEEDSDRIIDQVKYADEIKPGTTYREILEDYLLRKDLLIKILEFYEQESSKEYFDYNDFVQIENNIKNKGKKYTWSSDNIYFLNSSIKNISDKKIDLGLISFFTNKLLFYNSIESLLPGEKLSFSNSFYSYNEPKISNLLHLKIGDSIYHPTEAYLDVVEQLHHLISEELISDITKYYNQKPNNKKISDFITDIEIDQDFVQNKNLTFEDVLLAYENKKKLDYRTAEKSIKKARELIIEKQKAILKEKEAKLLREKRRKKRELADTESRRKKRALMKIKNQDREDFITLLKQYSVDDFNTKDALRKYDNEINDFNVLWDDTARMIMKNKTEIGSGQFKSLRVSFQVIVGGKEKTTLFSITVPYK